MRTFLANRKKGSPKEEIYPARGKDRLFEAAVYVGFACILYLFFKSVFAFVLLIPFALFYHRFHRKECIRKYREELNSQFKDALLSVSAALRAGYSMENALVESASEMEAMYGRDALICVQLTRMKNELSVGMQLGSIFQSFAERSGSEDIETFAAVFAIATRSGGDLVEIIRKTASDIASKIDTQEEIAVVVRAKRLEQNIMTLMPPLIILYVDLTAGSMLDPLYQTLTGRIVMFVCLLIYAGACYLGQKITRIRV